MPDNALAISAVRMPGNPLIDFSSSNTLGDNINGPSVIKVPEWIENPLGAYYMYFAHHHSQHIRLAYADSPMGPWMIYEPGTLRLDQTCSLQDHIASPDVHVDHENREIRMYYHGLSTACKQQMSSVAFSRNGLDFSDTGVLLGRFYFRCWQHDSFWYALAKKGNDGWNILYRSKTGKDGFEEIKDFLPTARHTAVLPVGDTLVIFYSATGDAPERIKACTVDMRGDCNDWVCSDSIEILKPEGATEGANYPIEPSRFGSMTAVNQLRDPCVFVDEDNTYLYYSYAGEEGIAGAQLTIQLTK